MQSDAHAKAHQTRTKRQAGRHRQAGRQTGRQAGRQTDRQAQINVLAGRQRQTNLLLAAQLVALVLVTGLEGVPVTLAAAAPGIVAQGADEDGLPTQHHCHPLHSPQLDQYIHCHVILSGGVGGGGGPRGGGDGEIGYG